MSDYTKSTAKRIYRLQQAMDELYAKNECVELTELVKAVNSNFIEVNKDITIMVENKLLTLAMMRELNFKHTHYVKRYTKSKGLVVKPVKYFLGEEK